jgi:hypothetical protein
MTTLEYMEKQLKKHQRDLEGQINRNAPSEVLDNIQKKIDHYTAVCEVLRKGVENDNGRNCKDA